MDYNSLGTLIAGSSLAVNRTVELAKPVVTKYITDPETSNIVLKLLQAIFSVIVATQLPIAEIVTFLNLSIDNRIAILGLAGAIAVGGEGIFTILKTVQSFQKSLTPPTVGG